VTVERLYVLFLLTRCTITLTPYKALVGNILYPVLAEHQQTLIFRNSSV